MGRGLSRRNRQWEGGWEVKTSDGQVLHFIRALESFEAFYYVEEGGGGTGFSCD